MPQHRRVRSVKEVDRFRRRHPALSTEKLGETLGSAWKSVENEPDERVGEKGDDDRGWPLREDGIWQTDEVHLLEHPIDTLAELAPIPEVAHRIAPSQPN